ncbi:MAG: hypothetical protein CL675_03120 [Bdellovibrionaceae bacterium]|nr:hypothetical protein [Pseudobdellovibrionaceae bacterium]
MKQTPKGFANARQKTIVVITLLLLPLLYQNCASDHSFDPNSSSLSSDDQSELLASAEQKSLATLSVSCVGCHNEESVENGMVDPLDRQYLIDEGYIVPGQPQDSPLYVAIVDAIEPRDAGALSTEEKIAIRDWINFLGDNYSDRIDGVPDLPGEERPPGTYTEVAGVIQRNCGGCHINGNQAKFGTYEQLLNGYVIPNNLAGSLLWERIIDGTMPPAGMNLSAEDAQILSSWVTAGALNN